MRTTLSRRTMLQSAALGGGCCCPRRCGHRRPPPSRPPRSRPAVPYGVQVGDLFGGRAIVWSQDRSAGADAGALGHHREHGRAPRRQPIVDALEDRDFTAKVDLDGLPAGQRIFYEVQLPRSGRSEEPAASRYAAASSPRRRAARRPLRLVGRHGRAGLGHQSRPGRDADLRDDAPGRARLLHPFRRHDLRRRPGLCRGQDVRRQDLAGAGRQALAQRHHPREGEGRRDVARVPDELRLQPDGREPARASMRRCRCTPSGTTTRSPTTGTGSCARTRTSATGRAAWRCSRRGRCARSTTTCRPACTRSSRTGSTPAFAYGPSLEVFRIDLRSYRGPNSEGLQTELSPEARIIGRAAAALADAGAEGQLAPPGR